MKNSLRRAVLGALVGLAVTPSLASAAFTPTITQSTKTPGCAPKALLAFQAAAGGVAVGTAYTVTAIVNGSNTTPCGPVVARAASAATNIVSWNPVPGATGYRVYRGAQLLNATLPADATTCPAPGKRCQTLDTGAAPSTAATVPGGPADLTQGGSHPDLNIAQAFDYSGATNTNGDDTAPDGGANSASLKANVLTFPAGLLANPTAAGSCTFAQFVGSTTVQGSADANEDTCPRSTQVGHVTAIIQSGTPAPANPARAVAGDIYLGEKLAGDPASVTARLYVALRPPCSAGYPAPLNPGGAQCNASVAAGAEVEKSFLSAKASILQDGTYRIQNTTTSIASGVDEELASVSKVRITANGAQPPGNPVVPIQVQSITQSLYGNADQGTQAVGDDKPFVTLPTSCVQKSLTADAASYLNPVLVGSSTNLQATGCDAVPFSPELSATIDISGGQSGQNGHPSFTANIVQTTDEAATKTAVVTLPKGLGTNIDALARVCTVAQQASVAGCPATSIVGSADATTSVLPGLLAGPVYIAENNSPYNLSGLPKLIVALDGAAKIRLDGAISFDQTNTRLVNTFDNLPEVTLSTFRLTINGGTGGLLQNTQNLCTQPLTNADATFVGYNGKTVTQSPGVVSNQAYYCVPPPVTYPCKPAKPKQSLSVSGVGAAKPKLKSTVKRSGKCAKGNLRVTTVKLAKGLKFAKAKTKKAKKKFLKRISVKANGKKIKTFKAKGRKLTIKTKANTKNIAIKTKSKAIKASGKVVAKGKKQKLKFATKVKVKSGKTFLIKKTVKPKS